jgi:ribosomal protein L24
MKQVFSKSAKLLILTLMSILVISATAAMYYSLSMSSTIDVYAADVYFVVGNDNGTKGMVVTIGSQNTTVTVSGLRAYPNATFTYTDPLRVKNNGISAANLRLVPNLDPSTNPEDFVYVKFLLNATAAADRKWLNYTSNGVTWTSPSSPTSWTTAGGIGASAEWPIVIMTMANATAVASESVTISITIDVD